MAGTVTTVTPTSLVYGGGVVTPPTDVQVFVPIATGLLNVQYPLSGFAGTLYSVEGISRTKTITVREWTDYSLNANMATYAYELFTTICDVVVEGTLDYLGLATPYLTPGQAVSIAGNGYTTGYETIGNTGGNNGIAVASVDVQFQPGPSGTSYITTLHLSNRKQRYTGDIFIRPAAVGQKLGADQAIGNWQQYQQTGDKGGTGPQQSDATVSGLQGVTATAQGQQAGVVETPLAEKGDDAPPAEQPAAEKPAENVNMPMHPEAGLGGGN